MTLKFKVQEAPYETIRETRKARKKEIKTLLNHITAFQFLNSYAGLSTIIQILFAQDKLAVSKFGKDKTDLQIWQAFISHNEILTPTMGICSGEFQGMVSELLVGAYSGASRTLRYILEAAVEACVFQTEERHTTFKQLLDEYLSLKGRGKRLPLAQWLMRHNLWASFTERYSVYEQTKRIAPSYAEQVNVLNSRQIFQEAPEVQTDLKKSFETLSDYVHLSSIDISDQSKRRALQRFEPERFDATYRLALGVLDLAQFLYVKSISHFYGYPNVSEFLKILSTRVGLPRDMVESFLRLPSCSKLASNIVWGAYRRKGRTIKLESKTSPMRIASHDDQLAPQPDKSPAGE